MSTGKEQTAPLPARRPHVGVEIRRWRRTRDLTLAQVSERSGLNIGYLSQIENDKAVPSLDALAAIADALTVPAAWLLLDSSPPPRVVRVADRPRVPAGGSDHGTDGRTDVRTDGDREGDSRGDGRVIGGSLEGLALTEVDAGTSRDLCILEAVVPPGGRTGQHAHSGDEHHVIISGRWRMTQGEHVVELGPGDYLAWDPSVPHDVENVGDEPGRLLLIYPRHARTG